MLVFVNSANGWVGKKRKRNAFYLFSILKVKVPKESINRNVSKPPETTHISNVSVCIQALCFCDLFFR
jgi:hypothetical protein